ncbi:MAG: glycosyltransferase [Burkholderiales bacterium]
MIPLRFHFIFGLQPDFGGKPFSFMHYMAVKSALTVHPGAKAFLHYEHEPKGIYWEVAKRYAEPVRVKAPKEIFGRPLLHVAHQTDLLRLQILHEQGGIYLDIDTITTGGFASLLAYSCVMARQGYGETDRGMCNAVILSEPRHPFIAAWIEEFKVFRSQGRDEFWDEHAVVVPRRLMDTGRYEVRVLQPEAFFVPSYDTFGIADMFIDDRSFPQSLCHHLWESQAWHVAARIDERNVATLRNTYCRLAKDFVGEDAALFREMREAEMVRAAREGLRVNLGCGVQRIDGWVNVDREPQAGPDMLFDIGGEARWPLGDDSVVEANASHVLEHLSSDGFRRFFQELYRVCRDGAAIHLRVPNPTHDWFWTDPEHVRPVLPATLEMLNREQCRVLMVAGDTKTPLAVYWDVDFVLQKAVFTLDPQFDEQRAREGISDEEVIRRARHQNNIVGEYVMDIVARKPVPAR